MKTILHKIIGNVALVLFLLVSAISVFAQPTVITQPSADAKMYTAITVNARKLRVPLATALAQIPGEECFPSTDTNANLNCPGVTVSGMWTYKLAQGMPAFTVTVPSNDPRKPAREQSLKIDGITFIPFSNFKQPDPCVIVGGVPVCSPAPFPETINVSFNRPTTEFSFRYRTNFPNSLEAPFITGFIITANGVNLGFHPSDPNTVQTIGVRAAEGLQSVSFFPVGLNGLIAPNGEGPFWGDKLYYK